MVQSGTIEQLFGDLLNKRDILPYPYQLSMAQLLLNGKNVVISAPTGAGKTWAAILPFVYSRVKGEPMADRLIYVLPLRSLANSLHRTTLQAVKHLRRYGEEAGISVTLQTGADKGDPFFEGDIIFTTIDQLLSGYLFSPVSLPARLANINAGALPGSLIVLDEVHLLDPARSLRTALEMSNRLKGLSQVVWMTATLSSGAQSILAHALAAERIALPPDEVMLLPSHQNKQRRYRWSPEPLRASVILASHKCRSIVICNSVGRAQTIYQELIQLLKGSEHPPKLLLLHNRFFNEHRLAVEQELNAYFGPGASEVDAILVATQVIEAGMDISADQLHTELAPINSLIQRAGRCARYAGSRGIGTVTCYALPVNAQGQPRLGTYREQATIVQATVQQLIEHHDQTLSFQDEQHVTDAILGAAETSVLKQVVAQMNVTRSQIVELQCRNVGRQRSEATDLIRDIDSVNVWLTDDTAKWDPYLPVEYLNLPRVSLWQLTRALQTTKPWGVRILIELGNDEAEHKWLTASSGSDLQAASWLIAIHPNMASYSPDVGLLLGQPGPLYGHPLRVRQVIPRPDYECETWLEHVKGVLAQGKRLNQLHSIGVTRVLTSLGIRQTGLLSLPLLLHDLGKLTTKWQEVAYGLQENTNPEHYAYVSGEPLAHTTFRWMEHHHLGDLFPRPNHAAAGGFAAQPLIYDCAIQSVGDEDTADLVTRCITSAITKHHHADAHTLENFQLTRSAKEQVANALGIAALQPAAEIQLLDSPNQSEKVGFSECCLLNPSDYVCFPLYWLLVRITRLADQRSQGEKEVTTC